MRLIKNSRGHRVKLFRKLKKARQLKKDFGWSGVWGHCRMLFRNRIEKKNYQKWIEIHRLTENDKHEMRRRISEFSRKPLISVVLPVYNVEEKWLRLCIESVLSQIYENWELCIADDCSPNPHIRRILEEYAARDKRIKVIFRTENGHISAASNSALELAGGEFCALLDHDDELTAHALFSVALEINRFPETKMIYSDEDMIDERGRRFDPKFKPDWSRDLFYSLNLITHLSVYRTDILRKIGGFRTGVEGSQDYDLALRFIEQISENEIRHIPDILYHWRAIRGSVALSSDEKPYAHERARDAIRSHLKRTGKRAEVTRTVYNLHRVIYELPESLPKVSLILVGNEDFAANKKTIKNFIEQTDYRNFEVIFVCSKAIENRFSAENVQKNIKIIACEQESIAGKYNFGASNAAGEIFCFVNVSLRPSSRDWLAEMARFALQPEIGAVGAKVKNEIETIMCGGIILGINDLTDYAFRGLPADDRGNFQRAQVVGNFSAVSINCLMTRREVFEDLNGFDAKNLPNDLFDIDFCLKLRTKNRRVVFTPFAELIGSSLKTKAATGGEKDFFKRKWKAIIAADPFYNPNLSRRRSDFSIKVSGQRQRRFLPSNIKTQK